MTRNLDDDDPLQNNRTATRHPISTLTVTLLTAMPASHSTRQMSTFSPLWYPAPLAPVPLTSDLPPSYAKAMAVPVDPTIHVRGRRAKVYEEEGIHRRL